MRILLDSFPFLSVGLLIAAVTFHTGPSNGLADSKPKILTRGNIFSLSPTQAQKTESASFLHTIQITVTHIEDIKVKEKQQVKKGDIISDRISERSSLLTKKRQLEIAMAKASLPLTKTEPITKSQFQQERMALHKAQSELTRVTQQIDHYQGFAFKDPQLSEILEPEKVKELAALKEKQILATVAVKEALARLNAAQIQHSLQLTTYQTNLSKQKYELESLRSQLQEVNEQIQEIVAVRSPYDGSVYRVKILGQNDRNLTAEIVLTVKR
ncbi:hypothetical protein [Gloeothece verrucosa]|uniref:Uncharacterized protein n=1 Tax=Gloeothece verrucosa (strain PCC 7822) TaxID=497965 RepID=E0UJ09_GLOV7|nr:hypothetical protein [Gloeothece verrucosa]ADN14589.1 hypothetical protein Cyan7822_2619 [Gloeothece verrucosa PCC 7822]